MSDRLRVGSFIEESFERPRMAKGDNMAKNKHLSL